MTTATPPSKSTPPPSPAATPEAPLSPIRAAIAARMRAKKIAAAKPPPPPGRKAQELDVEAGPRSGRPAGPMRRAT